MKVAETYQGKSCIKCTQTLRYKNSTRCVNCQRNYDSSTKRKEYDKSPKRKIGKQISNLKIKYGISLQEKKQMLSLQSGLCEICQRFLKKSCVDHDHITGKIRGLLCLQCNSALGLLKEDSNILQNAINYIKKYSDQSLNPSSG